MEKLINVDELAEILRVSKGFIYKARDIIPRLKIGGRILFRPSSIEAMLKDIEQRHKSWSKYKLAYHVSAPSALLNRLEQVTGANADRPTETAGETGRGENWMETSQEPTGPN